MLNGLKTRRQRLTKVITNYSCDHIVRLISIMPKIGGFPLRTEKIFVPFWILHFTMAIYVYFVGVAFYQIYQSVEFINSVSSVFNVLVVCIVFNNSFWFLLKRNDINNILNRAMENDALIIKEGRFFEIYEKLMRKTKIIVIACYTLHFINDGLVFIPKRIFDMASFSIATCVGLEPLSAFPNREICMVILASQELTSILIVAGYDVIILFLYSHTTTIYIILCKDLKNFSELTRQFDGSDEIKLVIDTRLKSLIHRHSLVLLTVKNLQELFSIAIGVVIILNTISVCTFFVLPLEVGLSFAPLISYTLTIFFLYCLLGQKLINASEEFEMAVYCCGWEKLDLRHQKVILLMLKQAQRPVMLQAAGMVPICMTTFASSMQVIYRFITVFRV